VPVCILTQSLFCQHLHDTFLGSGGQKPIIQVRQNVYADRVVFSLPHIVFRYFPYFGSAQGAICLQQSRKLARFPLPSCPRSNTTAVTIHLHPLFVLVQTLGAWWRLWTVGHGVEAGFNLSWLCDQTKLSCNVKRSEGEFEGSLRFIKCQTDFLFTECAPPSHCALSGVRHGLEAEGPDVALHSLGHPSTVSRPIHSIATTSSPCSSDRSDQAGSMTEKHISPT